jgi:light-regulated signal transduction histidine kinase (bacteriophytochrome)
MRQVRALTGFDRAMVLRFDQGWNGTVVAEDRSEELPSYRGLRFPASDISAQARELYRLNRLRLIPDADYVPLPIRPEAGSLTGRPADLGLSVLRSVSPVHLEYMRNMRTGASMSVSVLREGRLWGLISCHSRTAHHVPPSTRAACDLLGQIFALQIAAQEQVEQARHRVELQSVQSRLLGRMATEANFLGGLLADPEELLRLAGAQGAAVVFGDRCESVGTAPAPAHLREIAGWLRGAGKEVFATDTLAARMPRAERFKDSASGLLAISISKLHAGYVMWFHPEVVETVSWGGDPQKPAEADGLRLHPRQSFEVWKEMVRDRALPWRQGEIDTAGELRNAIVGIVLRKAEELAVLAQELGRSNRELEAFSYSVSHDLRAPFRHIVGFAELLRETGPEPLSGERLCCLDIITEAAYSAGRLVDGLLSYSQMGRAAILTVPVDMNRLVEEVRRVLLPERATGRSNGCRGPSSRSGRPGHAPAGVAEPPFQCHQVHAHGLPRPDRGRRRDGAGGDRVQRQPQRRRLRHGLCGQAFRRLPAAPPRRRVGGHRHRPSQCPSDRRASRGPRQGRRARARPSVSRCRARPPEGAEHGQPEADPPGRGQPQRPEAVAGRPAQEPARQRDRGRPQRGRGARLPVRAGGA